MPGQQPGQPGQPGQSGQPGQPGQMPGAQKKPRYFVAMFDYDPSTMSPNPDGCDEELPFQEGDTIKVRTPEPQTVNPIRTLKPPEPPRSKTLSSRSRSC